MKKAILGIIVISMLQGCSRPEEKVSKLEGDSTASVASDTASIDRLEKATTDAITEPKVKAAENSPVTVDQLAKLGPAKVDPAKIAAAKTVEMPTDPEKKTETVAKSAEPKLNATTLMTRSLATAKADNKRVFVHLTADW